MDYFTGSLDMICGILVGLFVGGVQTASFQLPKACFLAAAVGLSLLKLVVGAAPFLQSMRVRREKN